MRQIARQINALAFTAHHVIRQATDAVAALADMEQKCCEIAAVSGVSYEQAGQMADRLLSAESKRAESSPAPMLDPARVLGWAVREMSLGASLDHAEAAVNRKAEACRAMKHAAMASGQPFNVSDAERFLIYE